MNGNFRWIVWHCCKSRRKNRRRPPIIKLRLVALKNNRSLFGKRMANTPHTSAATRKEIYARVKNSLNWNSNAIRFWSGLSIKRLTDNYDRYCIFAIYCTVKKSLWHTKWRPCWEVSRAFLFSIFPARVFPECVSRIACRRGGPLSLLPFRGGFT